MKLSKQEQKELMQVYDIWWNSYLNGDVKTYDSYFTDDYHFVGSTNGEEYLNRKDTTAFFDATADQMAGKAELRNQNRTIEELEGGIILITDLADAYVISEPEWVFYSRFRFTSMLRKTSAGWRFFYQHFSAPDSKAQEGETLGTEKITKENEELRDAIKRRTVELEHKNRDLAIEASLERVRARTMAMQSSAELGNVATVLFSELNQVVDNLWTCGFVLCEKDRDEDEWWLSSDKGFTRGFYLPNVGDFTHATLYEGWKESESFRTVQLEGKDLLQHYDWLMDIEIARNILEEMDAAGIERPEWQKLHAAYFSKGYLCIITRVPCTEEEIFKRFAQVFDQTFTRFLDLQKAEAQAREAQIEVSLERVRSRAMIMHNSDELREVGALLYKELSKLGIQNLVTGYTLMEDEGRMGYNYGVNPFDGTIAQLPVGTKHTETKVMKTIAESWRKQDPLLVIQLNPEETIAHQTYMAEETTNFPIPKEKLLAISPERLVVHTFNFTQGYLLVVGGILQPFKETHIFPRFAKVFEQTYTRFLDLQKAEAQAREAQIEAALEKVRSRSLAMHMPNELGEVVAVIVEKLKELGVVLDANGVVLCTYFNDSKDVLHWIVSPDFSFTGSYLLPYFDHPIFKDAWQSKESGADYFSKAFSVEEKNSFFEYAFEHSDYKNFPDDFKKWVFQNDKHILSFAWQKNSAILIPSHTGVVPSKDEIEILKRFAKVFEQSYTRFLDLQKAEAQAREAIIENGLERVRAQTMAMNKSNDLQHAVSAIFKELDKLDLKTLRCGIGIINEENKTVNVWTTTSTEDGNDVSFSGSESMDVHPVLQGAFDNWKIQQDFYYTLEGDDLINYYNTMGGDNYKLPEAATGTNVIATDKHYYFCTFFSVGGLYFFSELPFTEELVRVIRRFAKAFSLTYKRFEDLKLSEEQAYKAKIEVALERVRARALAMQEPEELKEVAEVLRHEMGLLGVEELETCSIYINDEQADKAECWYALKDLRSEEKKLVNDHFALNLNDTWVGREMLQFYQSEEKQSSIVMQGANRKEWIRYCEEKSVPFRGYYGEVIPDRTYHLYKFSHGAIGAAAAADISAESWDLLRRAASVFSLAYSRFKDLTQARTDLINLKEEKQKAEDALTNLKAAQSQLVQSEKMASLGELTAGIAHEIQNPLNFVNNFSEVSKELLDEIKEELEKGNIEDAKEIMKDVIQNLEKINHHGKRADSIVKGMLQHSRSSSGTKEPTDINALADEYLRLAYHGLRAKDKTFNATMKTEYDETLEKINVIPQDIGRVILNLITNAFYVVNEKKKSGVKDYEPTVTIATASIQPPSGGRSIQIKVADNGGGIPQKVLDKIFQPFFTTKPTGQGTGLGLSLAYDIVIAHGGELKVETKESEGSEFKISLPLNH